MKKQLVLLVQHNLELFVLSVVYLNVESTKSSSVIIYEQ